jgi:hypothetical protein
MGRVTDMHGAPGRRLLSPRTRESSPSSTRTSRLRTAAGLHSATMDRGRREHSLHKPQPQKASEKLLW